MVYYSRDTMVLVVSLLCTKIGQRLMTIGKPRCHMLQGQDELEKMHKGLTMGVQQLL